MFVKNLISMVMQNLQDTSGSKGDGVTTALYIVLAALVIIAAGYFLLRKRK